MPLLALPSETLAKVVGYLPPQCALNMLLVCRQTNQAIDHWTVWRGSVLRDPGIPFEIANTLKIGRGSWKRYACADAKASYDIIRLEASSRTLLWLPQLLALSHPAVQHVDPFSMYLKSQPLSPEDRELYWILSENTPITINPADSSSIDVWSATYASSFCLASHVLWHQSLRPGHNRPLPFSTDSDLPELASLEWFLVDQNNTTLSNKTLKKFLVMLLTFANRATSCFIVELRLALAKGATGTVGLQSEISAPVSISRIPLFSLLKLPDRFSQTAPLELATCHLKAMTDPSFIEDGEWTGYSGYTGRWGRDLSEAGNDWFDPVGADNPGIDLNGLQHALYRHTPIE